MSKRKVDYIRNCVEEKVKHPISDQQYKAACERASIKECLSMESRINAIVREL